jgi:hypothetical protein
MNEPSSNGPRLGPEFFENRQKFPLDELARYAGLYVAWSWDGSRIVGSAADEEELWDKLVASGVDPQHVVFSHVDDL